jgi:uncharacterized protein (TIGR03435 family)
VRAQQPPTAAPTSDGFEVASIKRNVSGAVAASTSTRGGRFTAVNMAVANLIQSAYSFQYFLIVDAPDWARSERYDVTAIADPAATAADSRLRLQSLLADRFKLAVHKEMRTLQTYALVMARSDRQFGPRLKKWEIDCKTYKSTAADLAAPRTLEDLARPRPCGEGSGPGLYSAGGRPIASLVRSLSGELRAVVTDQTGLAGDYEMALRWNSDPTASADSPLPSLFTALQEQLGLKLEPRREPVEVLVVDRLERPTDN